MESTKESREKRGVSQVRMAVIAGVSLGTWRTFEVCPIAVTARKREACERALASLRQQEAA